LEKSAVEKSVAEKPGVEQPVVEKPAVEKPVVEKPGVEKPVVEKPAVEKPVVDGWGRRMRRRMSVDSGLVVVVFITLGYLFLVFGLFFYVKNEWCELLFKNNTVNL
jgi:hypothetical protein